MKFAKSGDAVCRGLFVSFDGVRRAPGHILFVIVSVNDNGRYYESENIM